ncbi:MAG: ABC transporter permease, partial [Candidatus Izemoplasmataceae bacterium]
MRSLWTLLLGAFKTNIKQTVIVTMVMALTATMLFSAFALLQNADSTIDRVLKDHDTTHLTMWFEDDTHDHAEVFDFFDAHEDVAATTHNAMIFGGGVLDVNGENVRTNEIVIANIETYDASINRLRLVDGEALDRDPEGIWLSTAFAYGEDIEVGDTFSFTEGGETFSFNVAGIVFDPVYSSDFMPPRFWMNGPAFDEVLAAHGTLSHAINVLLDEPAEEEAVWGDFLDSVDQNYLGYQINYGTIIDAHSMLTNIIGASLLGFSIILVFVGAFVIYGILRRTILQDMRVIGILKTQGFTARRIRLRYILQFLILALVAILFSIPLGVSAIRLIGSFMMRNLGLEGSELSMMLGFSLSALFMVSAVFLSAFLATRRIKTITPTDAIRYEGMNPVKPRNKKHRPSRIRNFPIPFQPGMRQCALKRGQTVFSSVLAFVTAFTIFYGVAGIVSLNDSFENMAFWGEDNRDLTMELGDVSRGDDLDMFLQGSTGISGMSVFDELPAVFLPLNGESTRNLSAFAYDDFDALQVQNVEGSSPTKMNEAAISTVIADAYDLDVGESFEASILGESTRFEVTGIYQTVIHMGDNIRVHSEALENRGHVFSTRIVRLSDDEEAEPFLAEHGDTLDALGVTTRKGSDMQSVFTTLSDILSPVMGFISVMFIGITLIILSNFVLITIVETRKDFGIFKTFGMTTNQIRATV